MHLGQGFGWLLAGSWLGLVGFPFFPVFFKLALQKQRQLRGILQAYLGVVMLQPHACTQRFRFRILCRTRSFPGRTSASSKERAALPRAGEDGCGRLRRCATRRHAGPPGRRDEALLGSSKAPRMEAERPAESRRWNNTDDPVPGTGKTHLARTIVARLCEQGQAAHLILKTHCSAQNLGLGAQTADHWVRRYVRGGSAQKLDWLVVEEITQLDMALWADLACVGLNRDVKFLLLGDFRTSGRAGLPAHQRTVGAQPAGA